MKAQAPNDFRLTEEGCRRLNLNTRLASTDELGMNGMFLIPYAGKILRCMVSDGEGWEHVSVSLPNRCPTWEEMCFIKDTFWEPSECVVQFHPPEEEYVNNHSFCLHLWKKAGAELELPPAIFVGLKS